MPAYKDNNTGNWFAKFYYTDWQGTKQQKWKRGFATKKEALAFERDFLEKQSAESLRTLYGRYDSKIEAFHDSDQEKHLQDSHSPILWQEACQ